jgi:hypothetical protein
MENKKKQDENKIVTTMLIVAQHAYLEPVFEPLIITESDMLEWRHGDRITADSIIISEIVEDCIAELEQQSYEVLVLNARNITALGDAVEKFKKKDW